MILKIELQKHGYAQFDTMLFVRTAIQARLNVFRDNKGGSVITIQTIEENNSVSTSDRESTPISNQPNYNASQTIKIILLFTSV